MILQPITTVYSRLLEVVVFPNFNQQIFKAIMDNKIDAARLQLVEELGHSRQKISVNYCD